MRFTRFLAFLPLAAFPAAAQAPVAAHPIEATAFLQWTRFDGSLGLDNFFAHGAQLSVGVRGPLGVEVDASEVITNGGPGVDVHQVPVRLRLRYSRSLTDRIIAVGGVGYVHDSYSVDMTGSDHGATALVGLRLQLYGNVGVRGDLVADYIAAPVNAASGVQHNINIGWRQGITYSFGRKRPTATPAGY